MGVFFWTQCSSLFTPDVSNRYSKFERCIVFRFRGNETDRQIVTRIMWPSRGGPHKNGVHVKVVNRYRLIPLDQNDTGTQWAVRSAMLYDHHSRQCCTDIRQSPAGVAIKIIRHTSVPVTLILPDFNRNQFQQSWSMIRDPLRYDTMRYDSVYLTRSKKLLPFYGDSLAVLPFVLL